MWTPGAPLLARSGEIISSCPSVPGHDHPHKWVTINTHDRIIAFMAKPSCKDSFKAAGLQVMFRQGYNGAGVRDIAAEAGAPHRSFTNRFRSKEAFALEVLDDYFGHTRRLVEEALGDHSISPRARLQRYLEIVTDRLAADGFMRGSATSALKRRRSASRCASDWRRSTPNGSSPSPRASPRRSERARSTTSSHRTTLPSFCLLHGKEQYCG